MKKVLKRLSAMLAFVCLAVCLFACGNKAETPHSDPVDAGQSEEEGVNAVFSEYSLSYIDGKQYIKVYNYKDPSRIGDAPAAKPIEGKTLDEIITKIRDGRLTHDELHKSPYYVEQNENGMEILDLTNPYRLVFPGEFSVESVASWYGMEHGYILKDEANHRFSVNVSQKNDFDLLSRKIIPENDGDKCYIEATEKDGNVEKTVYTSFGNTELLINTVAQNTFLQEVYQLKAADCSDVLQRGEENEKIIRIPDRTPDNVYFHRDYGDCVMELTASYRENEERLPAEYYLQFGLSR